ncbi:hypothetical protein VTN00DRAFT_8857 [Thermoascus crustaceus]|uniref:uncharacterized protein n=1 Tax=Thermoascus crustaceus TaxID=5088 RepID=UPI00374383BE
MSSQFAEPKRRARSTEAMIKAATTASDLKTPLKHAPPEVSVTTDILEVVISDSKDDKVLELLFNRVKDLHVSPSLVLKAIERPRLKLYAISTLLERDPDLIITEEMLITALKTYYSQELIELFVRHKKKLRFTEKIRAAIDQCFSNTSQKKMKELCYELEKKDS